MPECHLALDDSEYPGASNLDPFVVDKESVSALIENRSVAAFGDVVNDPFVLLGHIQHPL